MTTLSSGKAGALDRADGAHRFVGIGRYRGDETAGMAPHGLGRQFVGQVRHAVAHVVTVHQVERFLDGAGPVGIGQVVRHLLEHVFGRMARALVLGGRDHVDLAPVTEADQRIDCRDVSRPHAFPSSSPGMVRESGPPSAPPHLQQVIAMCNAKYY